MRILWLLLNLAMAIATVAYLVSWVRSGFSVPKWVHKLAIALGVSGAIVATLIAADGWLSWNLALSCLIVPPATAYFGWLWAFGPWLNRRG